MRKRALVAVVAAATLLTAAATTQTAAGSPAAPSNFNEFTVAQLESLMSSGQLTSVALTNFYIKRIIALDQEGPGVNAVIQLNPDALTMAQAADDARAQ
ncbi:MAG TPA: amidase, partial [Candidatus Dormibacteraeota bacterium]|nr:amidase [Candidatus Dormibacteraeota bacterium]